MTAFRIFALYSAAWLFTAVPVYAEQVPLKPFLPGSYQQLLHDNSDRPILLTIWSTTCSSCLEKMNLLGALQKRRPDINFIMLAADDIAVSDQIQSILTAHALNESDNWVFADENTQRLRYEIDPAWFGELPRTYFLNAKHERHGVSGALSRQDYETIFKQLVN